MDCINASTDFADAALRGRVACSLAPSASGRVSMNFHIDGGRAS
jgi:hypothetical protein